MVIDTSYLFAFFNEKDALHDVAVKDFETRRGETFIVPDRVVEELFDVTVYKLGIEEALETLGKIRANKVFAIYHLDSDEQSAVFSMTEKHRKKVSFTDYVVAYLSQKTGEGALTFDKQLAKLAKNQPL